MIHHFYEDENSTALFYQLYLNSNKNAYSMDKSQKEDEQELDIVQHEKTRQILTKVHVDCSYMQKHVYHAFATHPNAWDIISHPYDTRKPDLVWDEYENLDWENILNGKIVANSYCVRKGISRKAQLSIYLQKYISKHPECFLRNSLPDTIIIETWDAFDSSLAELGISFKERMLSCLWEVNQRMQLEKESKWILKPSATNKGAEVVIVSTFEELESFIMEWKDIREWVLQKYLDKPLLLNDRKFHIRVYVLAMGSLSVYVSQNVLLLTAMESYNHKDMSLTYAHITNTAHQQNHPDFVEEECIYLLNDMEKILKNQNILNAHERCEKILKDINQIVGELFDAYRGEFSVFQPLPNCFELFGLDFLIDERFNTWLLEVNPGPDFKQTGNSLDHIISSLIHDTLDVVMDHFFLNKSDATQKGCLKLVYQDQWGYRSRETATMKYL